MEAIADATGPVHVGHPAWSLGRTRKGAGRPATLPHPRAHLRSHMAEGLKIKIVKLRFKIEVNIKIKLIFKV